MCLVVILVWVIVVVVVDAVVGVQARPRYTQNHVSQTSLPRQGTRSG